MSKKNKDKKEFSRFNVLIIIMILIFGAIIWRLINIQVINGELYRETANQQNHKIISTVAPRGDIIDRNGKKFAESKQSYILTFTKTKESEDAFFLTMDNVFKILDENKEVQADEFLLKVKTSSDKKTKSYSFDFSKTVDKTTQDWIELRFKKDRGFDDIVIKKLYNGKKKDDLNAEELKKVDLALLKITPEEVFNELIKQYGMTKMIASKSKEVLRRYMLVKDTLKMQSFSGYKPITIANNLTPETAGIFEQMQPEIPGVSITTQPIRVYKNGDLGSAFLGYISKINPWDKDKYEEQGYDISSDYIGTSGIEAAFEDVLRGTKGQESIAVNKQGRKVSTLGELEIYPGQTIQLNIDKNMQYAAEKSLDAVMISRQKQGIDKDVNTTNANRGAVVVLDVNSGKVLALASRPGYDPNLFAVSGGLTPEMNDLYINPNIAKMGLEYIQKRGLADIEGVLTNRDMAEKTLAQREKILLDYMFPLDKSIEGNTTIRKDNNDIFPKSTFNYATKSLIPPGSAMKPMTAIAGLEEGVIDGNYKVYDDGPYTKRYPTVTAACWIWNVSHGSHAWVNIQKAMRESCNYYFYDVADRLYAKGGENKTGLDMLAKYAWKFGLGIEPSSNKKPATGIEIPENFGQVYNYESSKEILANIHRSSLVESLQSAKKPLNLVSQKEIGTSKEIEDIKKTNKNKSVFLDIIKTEMKKDARGSYESIIKSVQSALKGLIEASPSLKKNNYTDINIRTMADTIFTEINSANVEINSVANEYYAAIGQGFNAFTPLQLANYVSTMVNGGNRYELHLVDKILEPDGKVIKETKPVILEKTGISNKTTNIIKEGMLEVTSDARGTAYDTFGDFPIPNGGKTGSATFKEDIQSALGRTSYGYYIGFAPYNKPEIAICAVVFDGGHGGFVAPVAKAVYEQYFKAELLKLAPKYEFMYDVDKKTSNVKLPTVITGNGHD
ncbi:penicillin-binding protein [Clostridium estertheticum]|uniref:penicillin-binding transpeptidase domain-containing protein n=1 Tax=Clostridium estertheticum TaxID=238834 RepID=UPI0013E8FC87|nr:penicillin-binding transpeptidase domain-containing protein [Clostridium estertheticum]MBZ9688242.1 penicillin-binding protein [Clostridium estertheticum]